MPNTRVRAHKRRGTSGVRGHSRKTPGSKRVPHSSQSEFSEEKMKRNLKKLQKIKESLKHLKKDEYIITTQQETIEIKFERYPYVYTAFSLSERYPFKLEYYRNKIYENGLDTTRDISEKSYLRNLKSRTETVKAVREYEERFGNK